MYAEVKYPKLRPMVFEKIANPVANTFSSTGNHFSAIIPGAANYHKDDIEIIAAPKSTVE